MTITATPTQIETTTVEVIPGTSVNITNKAEVRDALKRIKTLKALEAAGAAAERERKALEAEVVRPAFGTAESLIVLGQTVAKLSSERVSHKYDTATLLLGWPDVHEAIHSEVPYRFVNYS